MSEKFGPDFLSKYWMKTKAALVDAKKVVESKNWVLHKEKAGEYKLFYRKVEGSKFYMYNGVVDIKDTTPEEFFQFFFKSTRENDQEMIRKCVPTTKEVKVLKEFKKDRFYAMYISVKTKTGVVSDREFLTTRVIEKKPDRIVVLTKSVDDDDEKLYPVNEAEKHVRGKMFYILDIFKNGNDIRTYNIMHNDPKGQIPTVVFNNVSINSCLGMLGYQKQFNLERGK